MVVLAAPELLAVARPTAKYDKQLFSQLYEKMFR